MTKKTCRNCIFYEVTFDNEPCYSCDNDRGSWQPLPQPEEKKVWKYRCTVCGDCENTDFSCYYENPARAEIESMVCPISGEECDWQLVSKPEEKKEVCVWRLQDTRWYTLCGRSKLDLNTSMADRYNPCPYCGRKIQVNE
jgi:hypothetical protein